MKFDELETFLGDDLLVKEYTNYFDQADMADEELEPNELLLKSVKVTLYATEIARRESERTNKALRRWTIAIGVMTLIMLVATVFNVLISYQVIN